ncbi:hypothetical protein [Paracoccus sp. R86501]|uniref:hypothetical protein n=1 Tax=Paracoccus sp. R86501 TaxID=3101711 RepID=UPI00366FC64E
MELKSPPNWSVPIPRRTTFTGCTEDWFARHADNPGPDLDQSPEILLRDLIDRAFRS